MRSFRRAFTLADMMMAIVLCVLTLIYATSMTGCGGGDSKDKQTKNSDEETGVPDGDDLEGLKTYLASSRAKAHRMQSMTHVRGIQMGMILYAQGNKDNYPGLDPNGKIVKTPLDAGPDTYGYANADGAHVAYRMAILVRGNYFSPEYMVSPAERNKGIKLVKPGESLVDGGSYSYAMLNIDKPASGRGSEWRATNNSRAVVVTDRNIGTDDTGKGAQSLHTLPGTGWAGSVVYNDAHAEYQTSDVLTTEYSLKGEVASDHLFKDTDKTANGTADADAAMVFKADGKYVNQQP